VGDAEDALGWLLLAIVVILAVIVVVLFGWRR